MLLVDIGKQGFLFGDVLANHEKDRLSIIWKCEFGPDTLVEEQAELAIGDIGGDCESVEGKLWETRMHVAFKYYHCHPSLLLIKCLKLLLSLSQ